MDISALTSQLATLASQASNDLQNKISGKNPTDPGVMLDAQSAIGNFSSFIQFSSALIKVHKDTIMSIISKI